MTINTALTRRGPQREIHPTRTPPPVPVTDGLGRPRVAALLEAAACRPLTVLQAPTGYGKTAAIAAWLAGCDRPVAWLSLDRQDDDPTALMVALVSAFEAVLGAGVLDEVSTRLGGGADLTLVALPLLTERVSESADGGVVLVLDDYHELQNPAVHELVQALLNTLAPGLTVVIGTRVRPPLRLPRRLAAREATVIGAGQLAFTRAETAQLLNELNGLGLSASDLDTVEQGTGGWPLGLSLLSSALQSGRRSSHRDVRAALRALAAGPVLDDVVAGLLVGLSVSQRRLRADTSVLERVNGPLAAAMLEDETAPALLEQWREQGEFVVSDDPAGGWLTCHPLIREALAVALARDEPGRVPALHDRASRWFEANGMVEPAIHHAAAGGHADASRLDNLLGRHGLSLTLAGRTRVVRRAVAVMAEHGELSPFLDTLALLVAFLDGVHTPAMVQRAWELHRRHGRDGDAGPVSAIIVSSPLVGDVGAALEAGADAVRRFGDDPAFIVAIAPGLAACLMLAGRMPEVRTLVEPLAACRHETAEILAHAYLGWACLTEGDRRVAEWHGRCAVALLESSLPGLRRDLVWVRAALADALRANGRLTEARAQMDRSLSPGAAQVAPMIAGLVRVCDAELALAEGDRVRARASAARARHSFAGCVDAGSEPWRRLEAVQAGLATPRATVSLGSPPTSAEVRVLERLAVTPNRGQIARELCISESTVKTHLRRVYRRLGAANRNEALAAARARGLLD